MKISFSTLGCPEWDWGEICAVAKDLGYDGIELRGILHETYVPEIEEFTPAHIAATKAALARKELEIPLLTSGCLLSDTAQREKTLKQGKAYIDTAAALGTPYVRMLADEQPAPGSAVDVGFVREQAQELSAYAAQKGVTILLETNGIFADSERLLKLLTSLKGGSIGVLWDIHHPYRHQKEPVRTTYKTLAPYIRHVHLKDSLVMDHKVCYKRIGEGDIPVAECVHLLQKDGYTGYLSLEWVRRWEPSLESGGLVFDHFIRTVKEMLVK